MAELQFLNLPAIDAQIAQAKHAEMQNAMAPFLMQKAQLDAEKGGLEMQVLRDKVAREGRIRNAIADLTMGKSQQPSMSTDSAPVSYAGPDNPASPRIAGPDWMPEKPQQAQPTPSKPQGSTKQTLMDNFIKQAEIYASNGDPDTANKLYEHAAKFMPEVHKIEVAMDNGKPVNVITYKDGTQQVSGFGATPKAHYMDTGGGIQAIDEYTQQPLAPMVKKTQTPDSIASNAIQIRGQNMTDARGREANDLKRQELGSGGKAPAGYRWKADGTLEAIPGGPGDKLPESQQKQVVGVNNLSSAIAEYRAELANYGTLDSLKPDARAKMGTKYNNMMLQAKEAYNLGVLNGPDFDILQSVITDPRSLKGTFTSKDALDTQASELDRIMQGVAGVSSKARQPQQTGGGNNAKPTNTTPKTGERVDGFMFLGGNPADPNRWKRVDK